VDLETKKNCTICSTELQGEFCHVCGQRNTGKRITFREWISDSISGMFSVERSVLASWWLVIRQPERIIKNYWAGNRGYYHSPGRLAFYAAFVIGLSFTLFGTELLGVNLTFTNLPVPPQLILLVLLIPLYALSSKLTFFRQKHNFLEHLIAMIYLFSTWIVIFVIIDDLQWYLFDKIIDIGMVIIFIFILFIWTARVHSPSKNWKNILYYTLVEIGILLFILSIIILFIYLIIPEAITVNETTG
jgi:hypothetical protein